MFVRALTVGPFQENCYLVADESTGDAVLVDPGDEGARLLVAVAEGGFTLRALWITHAHIDHIGGIAAVKRVHNVPVYLHPADRPLYDRVVEQGRKYGLQIDAPPPPDVDLSDGDTVTVGALRFDVMHVPGHAPGHVAFVGHGVVFGGDCLFAGSIGRTDLPLSDPRALEKSLQRFAALPPETEVYPGHGPTTTIGEENQTNPFLTGAARVLKR
ncbi:MAG: MBL fold metallo-hydrolase [Gemmatimonadetes bacterium]|nr:MBL fold metallo-hydrolase [Gemmatimonadota bacterium]